MEIRTNSSDSNSSRYKSSNFEGVLPRSNESHYSMKNGPDERRVLEEKGTGLKKDHGPERKYRKGPRRQGAKPKLTWVNSNDLPYFIKRGRRDETVMPNTSGYNFRLRRDAKAESRPANEKRTQQGGPVQSRGNREQQYSPYAEEQKSGGRSRRDPKQVEHATAKDFPIFATDVLVERCHCRSEKVYRKIRRSFLHLAHEGKVPLIGDGQGSVLPNKQWEVLVDKKVSSFPLPQSIQKEVRLIVIQVDKWLEDHARIPMSITSSHIRFHWTQDAKIDRVKTAKAMIANNVIDVKDRFLVACQYCFEDDVVLLWGMLSAPQQIVFQEVRFGIARFWTHWIRGVSPLDWEGIARTSECNPFGLRSFFPRLSEAERFHWLLIAVRRRGIEYNELQFCLPKLNRYQQTELMKECPLQILEMFLEWPVQGELVDVVDLLWPYLSVNQFHDLLHLILTQKIIPASQGGPPWGGASKITGTVYSETYANIFFCDTILLGELVKPHSVSRWLTTLVITLDNRSF
ncbi:uncharacterized protein TNCV_2456091 [Trichonephila clavipes]|nr:uncharacterized protein TNCV_2456091 [Trichonephila clavipes]